MPVAEIRFGEWLPDQPEYGGDHLIECVGAFASPEGYRPMRDKIGIDTVPASGQVIGAALFVRTDGTQVVCLGTDDDLYTVVGSTFAASSLGLSLTAASDRWAFEQFGQEIFATSKSGDSYYLTDVDSDTAFSAVGGTMPKANVMARVGDFLVLGDIDDGTDRPHRVQWSPFNNPRGTWGTDLATQAGYLDFPDRFGRVVGITQGDVSLVLQRYGISRLVPTGNTAFERTVISQDRGCASPDSVVEVGEAVYWVSDDGFYRSIGGGPPENISAGKVWRYFRDILDLPEIDRVQGTVDWRHRCIWWGYSKSGVSDRNARFLVYNWETERWSRTEHALSDYMVPVISSSFGDRTLGVFYDTGQLEDAGGFIRTFYEMDQGFGSGSFDTELTTAYQQFQTGRRSFVRGVRPIIDLPASETFAVQVNTRDYMGASESTTEVTGKSDGQFAAFNEDGRYVGFKLTLDSATLEWSSAQGLQVDYTPSGVE